MTGAFVPTPCGGEGTLFVKMGSLDRVLIAGRWAAIKAAKIYLNSGLAMLADLKITTSLRRRFTTFFTISHVFICVYIYICVGVCLHMYTYIYIHVCVCVYI